ncbi:MAG: hypothetical protein LBE91_18190 [Tannerella sp.]|jgi:peptidoglycan hydrolase CwlO-like protein|nr:hypothetical protein [Tannerella sp.]
MKKKVITVVAIFSLFIFMSGTSERNEVAALEDKIDNLEDKIDNLEDKLDDLSYKLDSYASDIIDRIDDI